MIFSSNVLKRWSFQKNQTRIWSFLLYYLERWYYLFPKNMILFFRQKMKDDLSQKNTWKYDIFFKCPKKMVFPKIITLEYDLSCIIWKDVFFPENMIFFLWTENERWSFSRITQKYDIFCIYVQMLQIWYYPSGKKIKDDLLPKKYT